MNNQEKIEEIKKIAEEILQKMTFHKFEVHTFLESDPDGENLIVNIETNESNLLIGQYGSTLKALQHVLRVLVRKKIEEKCKFLVDVNGYLRQRASRLSEVARDAAKQAIIENKPVILRPMSAYERRVVHLELTGNESVKTESIGEGEERKVVVRPIGDLEKLEDQAEHFKNSNI